MRLPKKGGFIGFYAQGPNEDKGFMVELFQEYYGTIKMHDFEKDVIEISCESAMELNLIHIEKKKLEKFIYLLTSFKNNFE